jgi:DNA helicase-2/ATP-dependent DNA helicase PcrA
VGGSALLCGLNPEQERAVTHEGGPLLVVAGAGSGKTRVLTHRIAWLLAERGVPPHAILAITFTNKAAGEMRRRLTELVGPASEAMWASTFHSASARILRRHAERLGYRSSFSIYDQADAQRLIGYVLQELDLDPKRFSPRAVQATISAAKNELTTPDAMAERARGPYERRVAEAYRTYQERLVAANAMDFDDLLARVVELLTTSEELRRHYQDRFTHVLVDEYQDTNQAQAELVALLGEQHRNVFAVGDSDQSVYRFRGADIRNILQFERAFPDASTVTLEQNYRSTQTILDAANALIQHNRSRPPKSLWTARPGGAAILRYRGEDEHAEAAWVAAEARRLHQMEHRPYADMAVFYRTNSQSRVLEEELVAAGVPYKVVGATRFYDRREVRDLLAWLRVVANPDDELSVRRALSAPRRGVGDASLERVDAFARARGLSLLAALGEAEAAGVTGRARNGIARFVELVGELSGQAPALGPAGLAEEVLDRSGYLAELEAEGGVEAAGRIENLAGLVAEAARYEDLGAFLEAVSLVADADDTGTDGSRVVLMTLHLAKGLEFPVVFLTGMEEGVFPHLRSLEDPAELEEERRLAYVGVTRARERLAVTNAWQRSLWGRAQNNPESRFLDEMGALEVAPGSFEPARRGGADGWRVGGGTWRDPAESWRVGHTEELVRAALRRREASPATTTGAERLGLRPGDDVVHGRFGEGVVLSVRGEGERAEAVVRFPGRGEKVLLLCMAPLKRA